MVIPPPRSNVIDLERARASQRGEATAAESRDGNQGAAEPKGTRFDANRATRRRRIIAVGGGKGGIGKTMVSANLGIALARQGFRVFLLDADLGGANLHTALGVADPKTGLVDFLESGSDRLEDAAVPTGVEGLSLIAGSRDSLDAANQRHAQKVRILRHVQALDADYVVLDLGAGTAFNVLDFFVISDHGVLVILPEPTSIENAYRFVKAAFFRRLQAVEQQYGIADLVAKALTTREGAARTPQDFVSKVAERDRTLAARLEAELKSFRAKIVVNQARTPSDHNVGPAVVSAWKKFFGLDMDYLGAIGYDDEAWRAVRKRRPVLLERPESQAAQGLVRIAQNLLALDGQPGRAR